MPVPCSPCAPLRVWRPLTRRKRRGTFSTIFDTSAWAVSILLILADLLLPVRQASVITRRDLWHRAVNPNRNSRASSLTVCLVTC
jgi:hypothetical protein